MIKLFWAEEENETISQSLFAQRAQSGGENIHKYFANLTRLCNAAYKTLTSPHVLQSSVVDDLNLSDQRQCYQCLKVGHIKRYCPLKSVKKPIQ